MAIVTGPAQGFDKTRRSKSMEDDSTDNRCCHIETTTETRCGISTKTVNKKKRSASVVGALSALVCVVMLLSLGTMIAHRTGVIITSKTTTSSTTTPSTVILPSSNNNNNDRPMNKNLDKKNSRVTHRRLVETKTNILPVFVAVNDATSLASRKFVQDLEQAGVLAGTQASMSVTSSSSSSSFSSTTRLEIHVAWSMEEQKQFIQTACQGQTDLDSVARFQELVDANQEHLATEIYKYCALRSTSLGGGIWLDSESPWMIPLMEFLDQQHLQEGTSFPSIAVLGDDSNVPQTIHGSLLMLQPKQQQLADEMLQLLISSPLQDLLYDALLLPRTLHDIIERQVKDTLRLGENHHQWYLLEQQCYLSQTFRWQGNLCPIAHAGFCCRVMDKSQTLLLTQHPLLPVQKKTDIAKPYNAETQHYDERDLPYISTIREQLFPKTHGYEAPNMFDILMQNQCLPDSVECARCLRNKSGANCETCATQCSCYCKALCNERPDPKHVAKKILVHPPRFSRDPNRLVPRIIHQTYFEELTLDKYPNMSRMIESFKQSGWEYRFYSDEEAQNFLSTHFPPEVREAYDTLRPGAFKADLFRYCALLIHGGVYADVDIILESNLDTSVPPDVGFVVPMDEPGIEANVRMCVWNGFIAAAPAHPFLASVIETVVNQVRNRFTSADVDATFCPNPELSVLHAFDTLFTAGPCALGAAINRVMGRKGQASFTAGEMVQTKHSNNHDKTALAPPIPGRTIILHQNKWDMGGHRFTLLEQNLVVAATDLPDSDDRESAANTALASGAGSKQKEHYSKTHASVGIYGLEHLYNEEGPTATSTSDSTKTTTTTKKPNKAMENVVFQVVVPNSRGVPTTATS